MKIPLFVVVVGCLAVAASATDCPSECECSDGLASVAKCSDLGPHMLFPERVKHLAVESVPGLQLNLSDSFFFKIGLEHILSIKISNTSISFIDPKAFQNLQELTDVNLSDNGLILIHPDTFETLGRLEHLSLSGNPLQLTQLLEAQENYFLKSTSLTELDLSRCQLSDISKKLLLQIPNLQYINLQSNNIKVIDDYIFEGVPYLDEIDLSNNMLMILNDEIFEDVEELTSLNLKNNLIENIDDLDLPELKNLDVSHNNIKMLRRKTFEGIPDLVTLNISHNEITWISEETFKDLTELRHLDLSHNSLIGPLPKFIFEENEFLETLSLAGNKDMHIFEGFSTGLPKLYRLDISECGLINITNSSFSDMQSLAILNISNNELKALNHVVMAKLHRLNDLDLSYNDITKVGTYTFASSVHLKKLNLSHNKLHHLSPFTFESTPNLSQLDLSHNQFAYIWHVNDSEYMKKNKFLDQLEQLNIAGNRIQNLHVHSFGHLTKLKAIAVMDNPLECTSEFPGFIEWLYSSHIQPLDLGGRSVEKEKELELRNLQWDDFMMDICKLQPEEVDVQTKLMGDDGLDVSDDRDLNFFRYTVIENENAEKDELAEEMNTYVWPTFLIVFSVVFLTLVVGNTVALLVYRQRNLQSTTSFRDAFIAPFRRTGVKIDTTTPRYHKLYEECSVPNTPIVKGNLISNLVNTHIKGAALSKSKPDDIV